MAVITRALISGLMETALKEGYALIPREAIEARDAFIDVWAMSRCPEQYPRPLWQHGRSVMERCAAHVYDSTYSAMLARLQRKDPRASAYERVKAEMRAQLMRGLSRHNFLEQPAKTPCRLCLGPHGKRFKGHRGLIRC